MSDQFLDPAVAPGQSFDQPPAQVVGDAATGLGRRARVLFLCTHNSARSQMAEGILRYLGRDQVEVAADELMTRIRYLLVLIERKRS